MLRSGLKEHRCYQMDFGPKKGGPDYYLTDKRIVDINKNKKQYESLRCFVCSNLARNPKQCSNTKCQRIMCERCRKESINECPNCKQSNP